MIFRRFVEAIRAQHWTTVLVELMVVIGGIFLGLRVDDWNEECKLHAEDRLYLQRLREDVLAMIDSNAEGLGTWQVDASLSATQSLQDCVLEDEDVRSVEFALIAHQVIQRLILERTT